MSTQPSRFHPIRRVVTGHDKNNLAKVIMDGPATNHKGGASGAQSTLMWITEGAPAEMPIGENVEDLGARILGTPPPVNGTRFAVITFPPGNPGRMHRTETIDYVIVLIPAVTLISLAATTLIHTLPSYVGAGLDLAKQAGEAYWADEQREWLTTEPGTDRP